MASHKLLVNFLLRHPMMLRLQLILVLSVTLAVATGLGYARVAIAGNTDEQICDIHADTALGIENYAQAINLHRSRLTTHPNDALAHYHLGFAYGMVGQHDAELAEYRKAAALGLMRWDLYLNLGRIYLEARDYPDAVRELRTATELGPNHSETHFNLGLAYERRLMLTQAAQQMQTALSLGADHTETSNMLAVIYAEEGRLDDARRIWTDLAGSQSGSAAARANLAMLDLLGKSTPQPQPRLITTISTEKLMPHS
jgi:Flp pilus assembly protein TadD